MDLGIRGRTAIVCASSQGLGKACAQALAEAGVSLVINGRNRAVLDRTANELRQATGADVTPVVAGVARQYADKNITINNLLPGSFDTQRLRLGFAAASRQSGIPESAAAAQAMAEIPAKRFGTPAEFGQTCAFSVHAAYLTGQNILLDGGAYPAAF
jgi:3-oxoacyl-[acyl-carrier protein] reductase